MSFKSRVLKGVKWTSLSAIIIALVSLLTISILTRYLEKSDFGLMAIVLFIVGFLELFNDFGLSAAILHKEKITDNEYSSLYFLNILFSFFLYLLLFLTSPLISSFYNEPRLDILIKTTGLILIFASLGRQFKVIDQKEFKFRRISFFEIVAIIASFIVAVVMALGEYGILALVYSKLAQHMVLNGLFMFFGLKESRLKFRMKFGEVSFFLRIGMYQTGGQLINYFNRDFDVLIISKFFSAESLGIYSLAKQLVYRPMQIINPIVNKVAAPSLALFQKNHDLLKNNYLKLVNLTSNINLIIYTLVFCFAPLIVNILYGGSYNLAVPIVRILCVFMYIRSTGNPVGSLTIATGKTDLEFRWNGILLFVIPTFVVLGIVLGNDVASVAWSMSFSMVIMFYPSWHFLISKMINVSFIEYLFSLNPKTFWINLYNEYMGIAKKESN